MMNPQTIATLNAHIADFRAALGDDDSDEVLRANMLEGETEIDRILSRIARARIRAKADAAGAAEAKKQASAHYDRRAAIADRAVASCDMMIKTVMAAAGLTKFAVPEGKISITPGRVSLHLSDDFQPPQGYQKIKVAPDNAAIRAALEAGEAMPGAELVTGKAIVKVV